MGGQVNANLKGAVLAYLAEHPPTEEAAPWYRYDAPVVVCRKVGP